MTLCDNCKAKIPTVVTRQNAVNDRLHAIGFVYYQQLGEALVLVYDALRTNGFSEPEVGHNLLIERGRIHGEVGNGKWLTLTYFRMSSGRYEVVAYVN